MDRLRMKAMKERRMKVLMRKRRLMKAQALKRRMPGIPEIPLMRVNPMKP